MSYGRGPYGAPSRRDSSNNMNGGSRRQSYTPNFASTYNSGSTSGSRNYGNSGSTAGYGAGSGGYGTGGYGAGSYSSTQPYSSSNYGSGIGGYGGSSYGSGYTSSYSRDNASYNPSSYGTSSYSRGRDYDSGSSSYGSTTSYDTGYGQRRNARDRSSERSTGNLFTPRNERRSSGDARFTGTSGLKKSSSYSGLHWKRDNSLDKYDAADVAKKTTAESIKRSHHRQGSGSSITSYDAVFEEGKELERVQIRELERAGSQKRGGSQERVQKKKQDKRDLETILGKEDHMLLQRILEENKELFLETQFELSPQEKRLIQTITDATRYGKEVKHLDILQIVESH